MVHTKEWLNEGLALVACGGARNDGDSDGECETARAITINYY